MFTIFAWTAWAILLFEVIWLIWQYQFRRNRRWWLMIWKGVKDPQRYPWIKKNAGHIARVIVIGLILGGLTYYNTTEEIERPIRPIAKPIEQFDAKNSTSLPTTVTEVKTTTTNTPDLSKVPSTGNYPPTAVPVVTEVTQTTKQEDFKKVFFTETNIQVIKIFAAVAFSVLAAMVLSLPFMNLEEFRFLGVGYKRANEKDEADKVRKVADFEYQLQEMVQKTKMSVLLALNSDDMYQDIGRYVRSDGTILEYDLLQYLANLIEAAYLDNLLLHVQTGVLRIEHGQVVQEDLDRMTSGVLQDSIKACREKGLPVLRKGEFDKFLCFPVPLSFYDDVDPKRKIRDTEAFLFYLHSEDGDVVLSENDVDWIRLAWAIVHGSAYLKRSEDRINELEQHP